MHNLTFDNHWIELEDWWDVIRDFMPADLDGDGDIDFLLGEYGVVKWLENQNGLGSFGSEKTITTEVENLRSVYAADLDSDSDLDIMSAADAGPTTSYYEKAWFENVDGAGTFGAKNSIENNYHTRVWAADMDGDGNMDYISASASNINWRLNLDGQGTFSDPITTSIDRETTKTPEFFQLDQNYPNPFNPVVWLANPNLLTNAPVTFCSFISIRLWTRFAKCGNVPSRWNYFQIVTTHFNLFKFQLPLLDTTFTNQ